MSTEHAPRHAIVYSISQHLRTEHPTLPVAQGGIDAVNQNYATHSAAHGETLAAGEPVHVHRSTRVTPLPRTRVR